MKRFIPVIILMVLCTSVISAQIKNEKKGPVGKWKFDAPYAPDGYTKGTIDIGFADQKYSATVSFTNTGYSLPGEKIMVQNDSLYFMIRVENTDVNVKLKTEDMLKMTGEAVYIEGTIPLTLTKDTENK